MNLQSQSTLLVSLALASGLVAPYAAGKGEPEIGREVSIPRHLQDGEEYKLPLQRLLAHGRSLFTANWTSEEGGGRPLTKGTGKRLSDPGAPLVFPDNFNRVSGPDANSCAGCHNQPAAGGGGDIVANVFVLAQRFDNATFNPTDLTPTRGCIDEGGMAALLESIGNSRATLGMFGSGYLEMLARQMTADLQRIRDTIGPGHSAALESKGISFGTLARDASGNWDVSATSGLVAPSLATTGPAAPPSLVILPFHQASNVVSLRQFSNSAFNQHHGIQSTERFGDNADPDGDGFTNEMTRADITAVSVFQATLPVPGRVIPNHPQIEQAILRGEQLFTSVGCAECHTPSLPLTQQGWLFTEPNPYNPPGNETPATRRTLTVDLSQPTLPGPRLVPHGKQVEVPCYSDLKVHDITSGPSDPNREILDMNETPGSPAFFAGNSRFLTRRLWDVGNKPNFFHHGKFTTLRQAIANHFGEAELSRQAFDSLAEFDRACVIEFLKSLQVIDRPTTSRIVDEDGRPKSWPPRSSPPPKH
ncbi:MAG: hypothetical protein K9N23_18425 [Akkermansiaceae bacterium]|nr:hypothetical protein [Akkermansiaceae bacterium]